MTEYWTPRLSQHARDRCAEMDIRTRRVKRVAREPDLSYQSANGYTVLCRSDEPTFRVVLNPVNGDVVTVIWWTDEQYERGAGAYTHPKELS